MRKFSFSISLFFILVLNLSAKEGMWIPLLLDKYNIEEMKEMGFRLTKQDIYDVNHSSMKDAVVIFGGGCTGEIISDQGLLLTNHHCGYKTIQSLSSVEHDYLVNGFWAMSKDEELVSKGLSVKILESMQDVTDRILLGTDTISDRDLFEKKINENIGHIEAEVSNCSFVESYVKPLFYGNQYFLYTYKVFKDIRLVGAPPSSIGNFGGETDNWTWPRHTGDFSVFRIYANKENQPAEFSEDNIPYEPNYFFPISLKGYKKDDFTMVLGFPGRTSEYLYSDAVKLIIEQRDPDRIKIRDIKKDIFSKYMANDPKINIQYAAKYSGVTNAWKKWQGEIKGLKRMGAMDKKIAFENDFKQWAVGNGTWETEYKSVFESLQVFYTQYGKYIKASDFYSEIVWRGIDVFDLASKIEKYIKATELINPENRQKLNDDIIEQIDKFYKDFNIKVDQDLFVALLPFLFKELDSKYLPADIRITIEKKGIEKVKDIIYGKSIITDKQGLKELIASDFKVQANKLNKDPLMKMYRSLRWHYETEVEPIVNVIEMSVDDLMKKYVAGVMEMKKGEPFYPDANGTFRISYGKIEGYEPYDGACYKYITTSKGILEKDNPDDESFNVPQKLEELIFAKDFGRYAFNDTLAIAFTASNHTSGGNSGSPVINADGQLIGINFDRGWEGTMSDIMYDPDVCRNISLDIRYLLFIIDKFAGAGYLLDEMEILD